MIKHFLKNGQQVDSVEGIILKQEDFPDLYRLIDQINDRLAKEKAGGGEK